MTTKQAIAWACAAVLLLLQSGCGGADTSRQVSGQVVVNGQPTSGVYVVLHAASDVAGPAAGAGRTNPQGDFMLRVPKPGEYVVTVFWPQSIVQEEETIEGPDQFRGQHRNPRQPLQTIMITEQETTLEPLQLKLP